jgi:hypothetical protein
MPEIRVSTPICENVKPLAEADALLEEQPRSLLHMAALAYARAGYGVFPCIPNSKDPATPHGFKDRTTEIATINRWWSKNPHYNVAVVPEDRGECVVDDDPRNGGDETLADLAARGLKLPKTRTIATPSGGQHLWFKGSLPGSTGKDGQQARPWLGHARARLLRAGAAILCDRDEEGL